MRKFLLGAFAALMVLAIGAGSAAANRSLRASVASGELGRITTVSRALTFTDEEASFSIVCEVTRVLSLHASVAKVAGTLAGLVREVRIANCRGGTVTVLTENLPWHVTYVSFTGTLPSIATVTLELRNVGFLVSAFFGFGRCLYGGSARGITGGGTTVTSLTAEERRALPLVTNLGGFECPAGGIFRGSFTVTPNVRLALG